MAAVPGLLPVCAASSASAVDALVGESAGWVAFWSASPEPSLPLQAERARSPAASRAASAGRVRDVRRDDKGDMAAQTSVSDMRDEPPSTWRWVWNTVCPAPGPVLAMSR